MVLEFWKNFTYKNKIFRALLTDLSQAFDCLFHYLLIAKSRAYGFDISFLNLFQDYLSNRQQRTKVDSFFSYWEDILSGVPQGSILGPLLLNIFLCDIFLMLKTVYFTVNADDDTAFAVADNIKDVIRFLEDIGENRITITWFSNNQMKLNPDK